MDKEMRTKSTRPAVGLSDTGIFEALGTWVVKGDAEGTEEAETRTMRSTFSPESNTDFAATDSDQEVESMTSKFSPLTPSGISCNQCWRLFKSDLTLKNHVLICQDQCQSCEELSVPCISNTNGCIGLGVVCQGRKERRAGRKEVTDPCPQ